MTSHLAFSSQPCTEDASQMMTIQNFQIDLDAETRGKVLGYRFVSDQIASYYNATIMQTNIILFLLSKMTALVNVIRISNS